MPVHSLSHVAALEGNQKQNNLFELYIERNDPQRWTKCDNAVVGQFSVRFWKVQIHVLYGNCLAHAAWHVFHHIPPMPWHVCLHIHLRAKDGEGIPGKHGFFDYVRQLLLLRLLAFFRSGQTTYVAPP